MSACFSRRGLSLLLFIVAALALADGASARCGVEGAPSFWMLCSARRKSKP